MNWAVGRRLFFLGCFALVLIGIASIFIVQFFTKPPTCSDGKKNGEELGIDCSGRCEYVCKEEASPIQVQWSRGLYGSKNTVDLVAYFSNNNESLGVKNAPYRFVAYDTKGVAILTKEGQISIGAKSNIAIFNGPFSTGERGVSRVTFEWTAPLRFSRVSAVAASQHIAVSDIVFEQDRAPRLSLLVENRSRDTYTNIPIVVLVYDKEGNAILVSRTLIDALRPDGKETLYFSWNRAPIGEFSKIEVLPLFDHFSL